MGTILLVELTNQSEEWVLLTATTVWSIGSPLHTVNTLFVKLVDEYRVVISRCIAAEYFSITMGLPYRCVLLMEQ